jgi:hypothetical protein
MFAFIHQPLVENPANFPPKVWGLLLGRRATQQFIQRKIFKNFTPNSIHPTRLRLYYYMKKLLLLSAVLLGAVTASQAGVRLNIGIPLPVPPPVVVAPAPTYVQPEPTYVEPAPPVYAAPPVVVAPPPVVVGPPVLDFRFGQPYWQHFRHEYSHYHDYHYRGHDHYGHDHDGHHRW